MKIAEKTRAMNHGICVCSRGRAAPDPERIDRADRGRDLDIGAKVRHESAYLVWVR